MKNKVSFEVRIDEETYRKLMYVSSSEGRNMNNHILYLARTNIAYYEKVHGKIRPQDMSEISIPDNTEE